MSPMGSASSWHTVEIRRPPARTWPRLSRQLRAGGVEAVKRPSPRPMAFFSVPAKSSAGSA